MPTVDLATLIPADSDAPPEPPTLVLGDTKVALPPFMPASFLAAYGANSWAQNRGDGLDKLKASSDLAASVAELAGPLAGQVSTRVLVSAIIDAYAVGEAPASSD